MMLETQEHKRLLGILYLDLDRFKFINDTLGHETGDLLLQRVVERISKSLDAHDFLARREGDEFAILLPDRTHVDDVVATTKRILDEFKKPFYVNEHELYMTASIGISIFPDDGHEIDLLMKCADTALHLSKERGKNQFQVFTSSMNVHSYKTYVMQRDLRKALEEDRQLILHYQPRVDPKTGKVLSAEALIRWNHEEWGMISPEEFIPLAEESGLIIQIGEWVLRNVCAQLKKWEEARLNPVPISINFSAQQFMQQDLVDLVSQTLESTCIDGSLLEIEVTESTILNNEEAIAQTIMKLKMKDIKIVVDDFGTGYSSLRYLQQFHFDSIKIDKSFISDLATNKDDSTITATIIQLAHGLGMKSVAEGVDSIEQLHILKNLKCDEIQGYLYSAPLSSLEFADLLKAGFCTITENESVLNRRQYFRVNLTYPLVSDMTIVSIGRRNIEIGSAEILVTDIGPGGLRFIANINLPINRDLLLEFNLEIYEEFKVLGTLVRANEIRGDNLFEYGVKFIQDENEKMQLTKVLNQLVVRLRNNPIVPNCRFETRDMNEFFADMNQQS